MLELLLLTICAVICGAESWNDIELFGKSKIGYLRTFLPFKNGTPSDDTLRRLFRAIAPSQFQSLFIEWVNSWLNPVVTDTSTTLSTSTSNAPNANKVIAIDGKTSRCSHDGEQSALHLVSAFATEARIVLGQMKTREKSNEITAIPELLKWLDVGGAMVTIDAMGCQKAITQKIVEQKGDYFIALKGNQKSLYEDVKLHFEQPSDTARANMQETETVEKGHGRIEVRRCRLSKDIEWLKQRHSGWSKLECIVAIDSERHLGKTVSHETRYFIGSRGNMTAAESLAAIRSHWGIENQLHWTLDMSFGEDKSRIRRGNAPANMAIIRHVALNMIRLAQIERVSIRMMRKFAGWDNSMLTNILAQNF